MFFLFIFIVLLFNYFCLQVCFAWKKFNSMKLGQWKWILANKSEEKHKRKPLPCSKICWTNRFSHKTKQKLNIFCSVVIWDRQMISRKMLQFNTHLTMGKNNHIVVIYMTSLFSLQKFFRIWVKWNQTLAAFVK